MNRKQVRIKVRIKIPSIFVVIKSANTKTANNVLNISYNGGFMINFRVNPTKLFSSQNGNFAAKHGCFIEIELFSNITTCESLRTKIRKRR